MNNHKRIKSWLNCHKCAFLTFFIVLFMLITPLVTPNGVLDKIFQLNFYAVMLFAPWFVSQNRKVLFFTLIAGAVLLFPHLITIAIIPDSIIKVPLTISNAFLVVNTVFELLLMACVVRYSLKARQNDEPIFGCALTFLLIGIVFGNAYYILNQYSPNAFIFNGDAFTPTWPDMWYFSFITLTTCGYGDITPLNRLARILASLETVCGVLYVALFVSRLLNVLHPHSESAAKNPDHPAQ